MTPKEKKIHIRLPEEVHKKLRVKCAYDGTSVQEYVEKLIKENVGAYSVETMLEQTGLQKMEERAKVKRSGRSK